MHTTRRSITRFLIACVLIAALLVVVSEVRPAWAGGVVTDCSSDSQFSSLLTGGGTITFNCGPAPYTILITSQKSINVNTTIDGGGKITLDGQDTHRLFDVGALLTLRNIVLTRAYFNGDGGAIRNNSNGTLVLENSIIRDSKATFSGGAILSTGPLTITNSLLEGNQAANGGALYPRFGGAQTTIVNSVLRDNHTTDTTNGWGGAILAWDGAPVTIEGSSIYSNTARSGGGIYNFSVLTLTNVTLSGNSAQIIGGGVYNDVNATLTLTNVTLSGNTAGVNGGGIYRGSGSVNVKNTIVANSPSGGNCFGGVTNNGFNFSSDNTCSFGAGRDNVTVMLGPLADNGGPTKTHMPQPGSPVIDNVALGCPPPSTDQRGVARPVDGDGDGSALCDAGAVEYAVSVVYLPLTLKNYVRYFEGPWEVEPNNTYLQANGPLRSDQDYFGRGYPNQDYDFFSIYLSSQRQIRVTVTNLPGQGVQLFLYYQLIDNDHWVGWDNLPPYEINCPSSGPSAGKPCTGAAGVYYIRIYVETGNQTTSYTLKATFP